ncbi:hypothetical protein KZZ52_27690 [Dactylosporangium sp. AC04546]|uniref:hypothetical protein n=1 Tax=Dactylosporangium sp. AC04546 TaxID=2862460 RepID=UPI001EE08566|nr:hypothetical protein [Dactylosporangium sp. AC04546]WVK89050.1 hypothetical protein KZZ52_27690 [Dactylosporangium sp. AC04546]
MVSGRRPDAAVAVLLVITVAATALVGFLGYVLLSSLGDHGPQAGADPSGSAPTPSGGLSAEAREDALAAAPMVALPQSAAQPQPVVAATAGPPIVVSAPSAAAAPGGSPFATGFPHTPEGALGQLAAIDEAAMSTTDVGRVTEVYTAAAMPGAVDIADWTPMVGVRDINRHLGPDTAAAARVSYRVAMGQIKGTVGPNFVVACVLGYGVVTAVNTGRAGVADCQRMVWSAGRWRIGPRSQPAQPPSAWPGSADAVRAGWRVVERAS